MKKVFLFIVLLSHVFHLQAGTNITTPTVSGIWNLAGSPYTVYNDIAVSPSTTLTIEPGVEVIFAGYYKIAVQGSLFAIGTPGNPINFHALDTTGWSNISNTAGGWQGIELSYNDSCNVRYCNVSDVKSSSVLAIYKQKGYDISYNRFYHNINVEILKIIGSLTNEMAISNCRVYDNPYAKCMFVQMTGKTLSVTNCSFYNNTLSNSVFVFSGGAVSFTNNEVYKNSASQGVIVCHWGASSQQGLVFKRNRIYDNDGGEAAAIVSQAGRVDIDANIICNNRRSIPGACGYVCGGGAIFLKGLSGFGIATSQMNITNNVISNNYSPDRGGGIELFQIRANIINNTFVNNRAKDGGAIYVVDTTSDSVNIVNNIFYGNVSESPVLASIVGMYAGRIFFDHNYLSSPFYKEVTNFQTAFIGDSETNVIGAVPGLIAPTLTTSDTEWALDADFHLTAMSPCLGKGRNSVVMTGSKDYEGNPRICGGTVDIGADEWYFNVSVNDAASVLNNNSLFIYPNPASSEINVLTPFVGGTIKIIDVSGRLVASKNLSSISVPFDISSFAAGTYFAVWECDGKKEVKRIRIQ